MGRPRRLLVFLTIATVSTAAIWSWGTQAANLQYAADYLSRQQANIISGVGHQLFFTPATTLPGNNNSIRLQFSSSPGMTWCRVAGSDLSIFGITNPSGATEGATSLPGTLSANCTIGDGITTFDTITVSGVDSLLAGTKYGLEINDSGTAKLGTPPYSNSIHLQLTTNNGSSDIDTLLFYTTTIPSDRVSISATVLDPNPIIPNPVVHFSGLVGSAAEVNISRSGTDIQHVTLGTDGVFDQTLIDQPVGEQTYVISAVDSQGRAFSSLTFILNLVVNTTTDLSNLFLGPSIAVTPSTVNTGETFTVRGTTVPLSVVTLTASTNPTTSYITTATASGAWESTINSNGLGLGTLTLTARSLFNSFESALSPTVTITILEPAPTNTNTTTNTNTAPVLNTNGTPPVNNTNTQPPIITPPIINPPTKIEVTDLNEDKKVNLIDFSILMFYWQQRNPANSAADINKDGVVDIIDISIMFFQWTSFA